MSKLLRKIPIGLTLMICALWLGGALLASGVDQLYVTLSGGLYQADESGKVQPFSKGKVEATAGKITRVFDLSRKGELLVGVGERRVAPNSEEIGGANLTVTDLEGSFAKQITSDLNIFQARWSPDGDKFAYVTRDMRLYVDTPDGRLNKLISSSATEPSWSSDGKRLVYSHFDEPYTGYIGYTLGIAVYDLTTDKETVYTSGYDDCTPIFSSDGKRVLFYSSQRTSVASEYILTLSNGKLEQITNIGMSNADMEPGFIPVHLGAMWSSDGGTVIFQTRYREKQVWMLKLDGNKVVKSQKLGIGESPSWVVDGKSVRFIDTSRGSLSIKKVDLE